MSTVLLIVFIVVCYVVYFIEQAPNLSGQGKKDEKLKWLKTMGYYECMEIKSASKGILKRILRSN